MIILGGDTFISNLSNKVFNPSLLFYIFRTTFSRYYFHGKVCLCPVLLWFPCSSEISFEAVFRCFYIASKSNEW